MIFLLTPPKPLFCSRVPLRSSVVPALQLYAFYKSTPIPMKMTCIYWTIIRCRFVLHTLFLLLGLGLGLQIQGNRGIFYWAALLICCQNSQWLEPAICCYWAWESSCLQSSAGQMCPVRMPWPTTTTLVWYSTRRFADYCARQDKQTRVSLGLGFRFRLGLNFILGPVT